MAPNDNGSDEQGRTGQGLRPADPHAAEQTLRDLLESLPGAVFRFIVGPDGSQQVAFINTGCQDIWEIDSAELENDPSALWATIVPEDIPATVASVEASARDLSPWVWRWRIVTRSGRRKWIEGRGQPSRLPDGSTLWNSMILDMTALEEARADLARREAELRSLRIRLDRIGRANAMGEVTAALAHEVNQPLSAIVNYLHAASDLLAGLGPDAAMAAELVARADEQARRTAGIIARIRSLFTGGEIVTEPEDLNAITSDAIDAVMVETQRDIPVDLDLSNDLPLLPLDRIQVQQVVVNFLRNAMAELHDHPEPRIAVRTLRHDGGVRLCVEDNGRGVPEELRAVLFEPFATGRESGGGIGLSIAASIVAAHGGRIGYEPAEGGGARFTVDLPVPEP